MNEGNEQRRQMSGRKRTTIVLGTIVNVKLLIPHVREQRHLRKSVMMHPKQARNELNFLVPHLVSVAGTCTYFLSILQSLRSNKSLYSLFNLHYSWPSLLFTGLEMSMNALKENHLMKTSTTMLSMLHCSFYHKLLKMKVEMSFSSSTFQVALTLRNS